MSADNGDLSVFDVRRMISEQSSKTVGKVYMTFGSTVSLKDYLKDNKLAPLNQANLDFAALQLSTHLILQQEYASPVVLNMIVASLLLQSQATKEKFSSIFAATKQIYNYCVRRGGVKMIMRQQPNRGEVLSTITKLGFDVKETSNAQRKQRVKEYEINMDAKREQKTLVGLAYYSNSMLQNLMMDACLGKFIVRNMMQGNSELSIPQLI